MKGLRTLFTVISLSLTCLLNAQEGRFGYIDFNGTIKLMPTYLEAQLNLQQIQSEYKEEIERSKREFERQYIEFMLEQDHMSPSIVAKRQKELQLLMDNNAKFRDNVQVELETKREDLLSPIKKSLLQAIADVCQEQNLDYVVDTGTRTYLYINQTKGVDITTMVYSKLGIESVPQTVVEGGQPVLDNRQ